MVTQKLKTHMRKDIKGECVTTMCNMGDIGFWMKYRVVHEWVGIRIKDRCKSCMRAIKAQKGKL